MNIKRWMYYVIFIFGLISISVYILTFFFKYSWINILGVTLITTYYHTCIRPLTGGIINYKYHNSINWNHWWFKEHRFEKAIYKVLLVKKWKKLMPTYDKVAFDFKKGLLRKY
ncbi:MAG: hypothetical protein ACI35W_05935 [Anaeroplasmataceae bacterium]